MASLKSIRNDDRGQLLLVGAFILAILLVALAVVLNAAVYTETLAARGGDRVDVYDTVQYRDDTERALSGLVVSVNDDAYVTRSDAESTIRAGVADWDTFSAREQAATGRATSVTVTDVTTETIVSQTDDSRPFTNTAGTAEWTVVQNVETTQEFTISVDPADLVVPTDPNNPTMLADETFYIKVSDSSNTWRVFVFQSPSDSSQVTVAVQEPGATNVVPYTTTGDADNLVVVDFVGGSVGDTNAPVLSFLDETTASYTVTFDNGNLASGIYKLIVDGDVVDSTDFSIDPATGPTARVVVTQLDVTLRYEMPNLRYVTPITVIDGGANV